jgi:acyl carrier protein
MILDEVAIEAKVRGIVKDHLGLEVFGMGDRFKEDLHCDSLDSIDLALALEEAFHLDIPDEEIEKMLTPWDIVRYITKATAQ